MPDEVQTEEIIKDIFKQGKECFIPRYKPQSNHMDMLKLSSAEDISSLALTSWNILQPSDDDIAREEALAGGEYFLAAAWDCWAGVAWRPVGNTLITRTKLNVTHSFLHCRDMLLSLACFSLPCGTPMTCQQSRNTTALIQLKENSALHINHLLGQIHEHPQHSLSQRHVEACKAKSGLLGVA